MHLSDGPDAALDIEVQKGQGAAIPDFSSGLGDAPKPRLALEKVHPTAIRVDVPGFSNRVEDFERSEGKDVRFCYLTRDPLDSLRSYLSYRERVPAWSAFEPAEVVPKTYQRSFETLLTLATERPGPLVRYEDLIDDPANVLAGLYRWLWPTVPADESVAMAARAVEMTRRERRQKSQSGPFLGESGGTGAKSQLEEPDTLSDETREAVDECRRLNSALGKLAAE
jgi:hypothetical protein